MASVVPGALCRWMPFDAMPRVHDRADPRRHRQEFQTAMVDWHQYLAPAIPRTLGLAPEVFLWAVGVLEIALGDLARVLPRRASYWVAGSFGVVIMNSFMLGTHYDVALRHIALLLGALALGRLASGVHRWHERHA